MSKLRTTINIKGERIHHFYCSGCECYHGFNDTWTMTGGVDNPTVTPSLLTTDGGVTVCHMFIKNGQLHFLEDCTHEMKGKIVDMEEVINYA